MAIGYKGTVPAKLNFKAGTTAVCEDAFVNKTAIKSVGLPSGMVYIGSRAFVGCTGLLDVVVPATVTYIGAGAFGFKKYEWVEEYSEEGEDDYDELVKTPLSGFTLYGAKYSEAASYAKDEKIKIEYTAVTPIITKFQNVNGGTTVYWNKDANAKYYRVFGMTSKGWQTICSKTTASSFTYKYKTPISGKYYYYTVRALSANGKVYISGYNKDGWKYMYIAPPAKPKLANTKNGVKVTVTKPKGATYLRIFRKTGSGGWTKVADTSNTSIVDKNAKNGVTYYYTARVINKTGTKYLSAFNSGSSIKCRR